MRTYRCHDCCDRIDNDPFSYLVMIVEDVIEDLREAV